jgi:hypothetical protein
MCLLNYLSVAFVGVCGEGEGDADEMKNEK